MSKYPEHVKLGKVHDKSQACGEFIKWLHEKGYHLGRYHVHTDACWGERSSDRAWTRLCGTPDSVLYPETVDVRKLLAEFFGIDEKKLESEKRAILAEHPAS